MKLLTDEIPSNSWLTYDTDKEVIRAKSNDCKLPLSIEDEQTMNKLIDFVVYSQNEELNLEDSKDYLRPAVGLAAPQIGVNKNMFYVRFQLPENKFEEYAMVNAKITARSTQIAFIEEGEGCLSVTKDHVGFVPRPYKVIVEGYDHITKQEVTLTLRSYRSIVFQHEIDHLHGKLYYDHINKHDPKYFKDGWIEL
ncbi:peptide deformylase [Spiroplasma sp. TIUS-1]|uniref:peptide deformylase n=1 Tax=Spiroplasma sp. TIUS-1 TaxID=216963 RepID=UPI0013994257|nr:peptide deformylase [Spiroplasma sp. TIUS-1]QHX35762.1 peptide deformylase [Spiroplasma sp. TIUS-1]